MTIQERPDKQSHDLINPAILYFGTPVVLVGTTNEDGSSNLAPISSVFWLGSTAVLGFGGNSHTITNLQRSRECTLNLPDSSLVAAVDRLALTTGAPIVADRKAERGYVHVRDKFAHADLTPRISARVATPGVQECPIVLECTVTAISTRAFHLVEVEVQSTWIHPALRLTGHDHRVDPTVWKPLIMNFQRFFTLGEEAHPSRLAGIDEELYR